MHNRKPQNNSTAENIKTADPVKPHRAWHYYLLLVGGLIVAYLYLITNRKDARNTPKNEFSPCEGFEVSKGSFENAKWILLGEIHTKKNNTLACIEKLTQTASTHTILLESITAGQEVHCSDNKLPNKKLRRCLGWDNNTELATEALYDEYFENLRKLYMDAHSKYNINTGHVALLNQAIDNHFAKELQRLDTEHNQVKKHGVCIDGKCLPIPDTLHANYLINQRVIKDIIKQRAADISYLAIFQNNAHDNKREKIYNGLLHGLNTKIAESFPNRNKVMMTELMKHHGMFTILVAGAAHINKECSKNHRNPKIIESVETTLRQLEENKDKNPYVILSSTDALKLVKRN